MNTIAVIAMLGLALAEPLGDITNNRDTPIHYRRFTKDMVGPKDKGGRWFKEQDPNWSEGSYTGPHMKGWNEEASKKSYYSYDAGSPKDGGMKSHDHLRMDAGVPDNSQWNTKKGDSDSEADLWSAYMKKEKYYSLENNGDNEGGYKSADIKGGDASHRLPNLEEHADTYMQPKDHLQFFSVASQVCNPDMVHNKAGDESQENLIKGLRARHNSGHTYQGCSLDNCAITVMYACSFMCSTCQAKWCRDQCQAQKERSGSCFKIWADVEGTKCKASNFDKKDDNGNAVLNSNASINPK